MAKRLYVGNLPYSMTEGDLEGIFAAHGTVAFSRIIKERDTGRSKGFAFVEMKTDAEAEGAMAALNGQEVGGRILRINEARSRPEVAQEARGPRPAVYTGA